MKPTLLIITLTTLSMSLITASESFREDLKKNKTKNKNLAAKEEGFFKTHSKKSIKIANEQDELSADVQDLIQEQTNPAVIKLLDEAESLMGEATERLEDKKTGGKTIAIETEIIEKIYEAAKQKNKAQGEGKSPMLEMMEGMMKGNQGETKEGQGKGESESGGEGNEGESNKSNDKSTGGGDNTKEERRVPKNTSAPNRTLPKEEQRALDAYNKSTK